MKENIKNSNNFIRLEFSNSKLSGMHFLIGTGLEEKADFKT